MELTKLGARIKQCRKEQHLTQEKLAELIDVSPHYIYEIERGMKSMSLSTLADVSSALSISADYLLFGKCDSTAQTQPDTLNLLLNDIPWKKRKNVAEVLELLLPYLK